MHDMDETTRTEPDATESRETEPHAYEYSSERSRMDLDTIHGYLVQSYWSPGIDREVVARAMANSVCFGAFHEGRQVGFGRVVTDHATFAWLADVFVLEEHRGRGISKRLLQHVLAYPSLRTLRRVMLATRDAHGLYAQFGFLPLHEPAHFLARPPPAPAARECD
jgi:GNAT superfamily N-acetyltransferase